MTLANKKKATFVLPARVLEEMSKAVDKGLTPSTSAFVREAIEEKLKKIREAELYQAFKEASGDASFMQALDETMADFACADAETARLMPE